MNLEQLFLVDEMFKQKSREIRLTIGRPISRSVFADRNRSDRAWAQAVKDFVYRLPQNPSATFETPHATPGATPFETPAIP